MSVARGREGWDVQDRDRALSTPDPKSAAQYRLLRSGSLRLGVGAVGLRQRHPALTLAAVHTLAAVLRRLALGGSLAGIHAGTVDGCGVRRHRYRCQSRSE